MNIFIPNTTTSLLKVQSFLDYDLFSNRSPEYLIISVSQTSQGAQRGQSESKSLNSYFS